MIDRYVILLVAAPPAAWLLTALMIRLARALRPSLSAQNACFLSGLIVGLAATTLTVVWLVGEGVTAAGEIASGILFMLGYAFCVNFLNWFVFTLTETSMHIHLLVEIGLHEPVSLRDLNQRYNKQNIIRARIPRLVELGQLRLENGRLTVVGSWVLQAAKACRLLRRILGIPVQPEQEF
jgi:hypothetical protein